MVRVRFDLSDHQIRSNFLGPATPCPDGEVVHGTVLIGGAWLAGHWPDSWTMWDVTSQAEKISSI